MSIADELLGDVQAELDEENASALDRMRARLVRGLAIRDLPAPEWLVEAVLPMPGVAMLYGAPKAGKSFAAIDLACSVATGRSWFGRATKAGTVLYVVAEGVTGTGVRADAWSMYHAENDLDGVIWHPGAIKLNNPAEVAALTLLCQELKPDLVIIDTFARCTAGIEENSAREMSLTVEQLDNLRDASGGCVLIVHHSGKDKAQGARGSSALLGAVDAALEVTGSTEKVTIKLTAAKDAQDGHAVVYAREKVLSTLVLVESESSARDARSPAYTADVLQALADTAGPEGLASTAWQAAADIPASSFYRCRKYLVDTAAVRNVGTEQRPRYVVGVNAP
jgi:hypothetical protein